MSGPVIMWFRQDLRLAGNPALAHAAASGRPVVALYVLDDETPGRWRMGGAARWWLHHSLANWQWVAGSGADAAPWFRIFNLVTQGQRFDPKGHYVRKWVPELEKLPDHTLHRPWQALPLELEDAGVRLGKTYPEPMVDHAAARRRALAAFEEIKKDR